MNNKLLGMMSGEEQVFYSADTVVQEAGADHKTSDVNTFPWKAALAANTRERQNGRRVVDCGGKGRVARGITSYSRQLYRLENQHDVVIMCDVITSPSNSFVLLLYPASPQVNYD